jgi:lysozyme family protein
MSLDVFKAAFQNLLVSEVGDAPDGGYNETPGDAGGATKYGLSLRFLKTQGKLYDKDMDGDVDADDVRAITLADAQAIYLLNFWTPIRGDELPPCLAMLMFDAAVNSGVPQAIRWLQQALGLKPDGQFGPLTMGMVNKTPNVNEKFHDARVAAMVQMRDWNLFSHGWARRVARLPFQAFRMPHLP